MIIDPLGACRKLTYLYLSRCTNIQDFNPLGACTELKTLHLTSCNIKNLQPLRSYTQLTHLSLSGCVNITYIYPLICTQLIYLDLVLCTSLNNFNFIRACTQLTTLDLAGCNISIQDIVGEGQENIFENCAKLQHIYLDSCRSLSPLVLSPLSHISELLSIHLMGCGFEMIPLAEQLGEIWRRRGTNVSFPKLTSIYITYTVDENYRPETQRDAIITNLQRICSSLKHVFINGEMTSIGKEATSIGEELPTLPPLPEPGESKSATPVSQIQLRF